MKKKFNRYKLSCLMVCLVGFFLFLAMPTNTFAQVDVGLEPVGQELGLGTTDIRVTVANIIRVFLGIIGMIAIVIVLYGGFVWMTAGGDQEKISKAKKTLFNGTIGLIIVLSSYAIAEFTFRTLGVGGPGAGGPGGGAGQPGFEAGWRGGALGGGIIESHYPPRNGVDIARNTKILITFKEDMNLSTLIVDGVDDGDTLGDSFDDRINESNIVIARSDEIQNGPFLTNVGITTVDNRTFVLQPDALLGSPDEDVTYTIRFNAGVQKAGGDPAFGNFQAYQWQFTVSTIVDITPPQVVSILPSSGTQPRNSVIQINFNEAVDPTTVSGTFPPFSNITVSGQLVNIEGQYMISNQYRTVEFVTNEQCGVNSCGGEVYCLPSNATIDLIIQAADLVGDGNEAQFPYNGVVDLAGNSLDGDQDGTSQGSPQDNAFAQFATSDEIDLTPPIITLVTPDVDEMNQVPQTDIFAQFSKLMMNATLTTSNISLYLKDFQGMLLSPGLAYWTGAEIIDQPSERTRANLFHATLDENTEYTVEISSEVKDLRQNCFNPSIGP